MNPARPAHRLLFWLRWFLTVACVGAIVFKFGTTKPWQGFHLARLSPLLLGFALLPPLLCLRAWKWLILIRTAAPQATWMDALRSYLGALPLSLVTPGKAGELIRGLYLPYPEIRGWRAAGLTVVDNWIDFAAVGWWTLPALAILAGPAAAAAGLAVCLLLGGIPFWLRGLRALAPALPSGRIARTWDRFWPDTAALGWKPSLAALGIGVIAYGVEWAQMGFFLSALGGSQTSFAGLAGNLALIQWANSVQITVAGLGIREGTTAWLLNRSGWDSQIVLIAAFLQTSISLLLPALAGLFVRPRPPLPTDPKPL